MPIRTRIGPGSILGGLLALVVGAIGFAAFILLGSHELRSKTEWGCLQGVEYEWRERLVGTYPMLQERHGYRVLCVPAADGDSGLRLAREQQFDLILLDVMLPGKDGFDADQRI